MTIAKEMSKEMLKVQSGWIIDDADSYSDQDSDEVFSEENSESTNFESQRRIKRKRLRDDSDELETNYENYLAKIPKGSNKTKLLLPTKTKDGIIEKHVTQEPDRKDDVSEDDEAITEEGDMEEVQEETSDSESDSKTEELPITTEPVATAQILLSRKEKLRSLMYQIGLLSSEVLENPDHKSGNVQKLLKLMEERDPEIYVTVRRVAMASLLEIFEDVLPSYTIHVFDKKDTKLKKDTLQLQQYESHILQYYQLYLKKLEKMSAVLKKKARESKKQDALLGIFAINCMSKLLISKPYFNYSSNIVNFLIPLLNHRNPKIRGITASGFLEALKNDKRGELSLMVLRRLNQYIKNRKNSVHSEVISILLGLQMQYVFLAEEKDEKKNVKPQSKKALKNKHHHTDKKLKEVEKEMLETKAEEDKQKKRKICSEITNLLFTIYFRILKGMQNNNVLISCLEGISRFSLSINVDFYQDLLNTINHLLEESDLTTKVQLHCLHAIFGILSNQASTLDIDPNRFFIHLYKSLMNTHAGKSDYEIDMILKILILIRKCNNVSDNTFIKRMAVLALNSQHNTALGVVNLIKLITLNSKAASIKLDTDQNNIDESCLLQLNDPENFHPSSVSLWEVVALQRYYHGSVSGYAKYLLQGPLSKEKCNVSMEILKSSPEEVFQMHDPSKGNFKPVISVPRPAKNFHCITNKAHEEDMDISPHDLQGLKPKRLYNEFKHLKLRN